MWVGVYTIMVSAKKIRDISSGSYGTVSLYANKERTVQFAVKTSLEDKTIGLKSRPSNI